MSKQAPPNYYNAYGSNGQQQAGYVSQPGYAQPYQGSYANQYQAQPAYGAPQYQAPQAYYPPQASALSQPPSDHNYGGASGAPTHHGTINAPGYCRDKFCAAFFVIHLLGFIALGAVQINKWRKNKDTTDVVINVSESAGIVIAMIVVGAVVAVALSYCFIRTALKFKGKVVAFSFGVQAVFMILAAIIFLIYGQTIGAVICFLLVGLTLLFYFCVRHRIPFTEVVLNNSMRGLSEYWGTFVVGIIMTVVSMLWTIFWVFTLILTIGNNDHDNYDPATGTRKSSPVGLYVFLFFLEIYWAMQVYQNISHTTTAGAIGTWWYQPGANSGVTSGAFKRASTTSLGSIALGSFIVAFLQALRAMIRNSNNRDSLAACILLCIIGCLENLMRYFNMYAYTQIALYGKDFMTAAKDTMDLFESKGFSMIINDDLTSAVVGCGMILVSIVSAIAVGLPFYLKFYERLGGSSTGVAVVCILCVFLIALWVSSVMLVQIQSAVCTTFVVWAEDPDELQRNRASEYREIEDARTTAPSLSNPHNR